MNLHLAACGSCLVARAGGSPALNIRTTMQRGLRAAFLGFLFSDLPVFPQVKCEHYWPLDTQPCTYGHLQVTLEGEKVRENWTVRYLKLQHVSSPTPPAPCWPPIPAPRHYRSPLPRTPQEAYHSVTPSRDPKDSPTSQKTAPQVLSSPSPNALLSRQRSRRFSTCVNSTTRPGQTTESPTPQTPCWPSGRCSGSGWTRLQGEAPPLCTAGEDHPEASPCESGTPSGLRKWNYLGPWGLL